MVNKCMFIGFLGRDPELRHTKSGDPVCNFSIAVNEKWNGGEHTEWVSVVAFGKQAEPCQQYLTKGRLVYVEGSLRTRTFTKKDGSEGKSTDLIASSVKFLSGGSREDRPERTERDADEDTPPRREETREARPPERRAPPTRGGGGPTAPEEDDDSLPF